ncbi:hypothetical protein Y032_0035g3125 [Ancylostoma ceylanicum]|uniref:Uncharacterized protein n=1 Tax=Ancylostoma ceylanicum TaxID=53326 RepID=A0A016UMK4_9BILA|nr:hypothetical protein Y032_0035g3125 [Ancylostoma ceylanicum]
MFEDLGKILRKSYLPNTVGDDNVRNSSSSVTDEHTCDENGRLPCKKELEDDSREDGDKKNNDDGPSFDDLIASFTSDIDAFAETVDDLENISESVQCLMRNLVNGDGRPVGAWKDLC